MECRLTAILPADFVGFSRLIGRDEEGTITALKGYRKLIDGLISNYGGRVFGSAGDSVKIGARLEAIAPPGGICVSKAVADQLSGKVDAEFAHAGAQELKNIANKVGVWT